jgi:hypothetical protein
VSLWGKNKFCNSLKTNAKEAMWASEVELINGNNTEQEAELYSLPSIVKTMI